MLFKSGLLLRLKRSELWLSRMLTLVGFKSLFSAAHPDIMKNVLIASGLLQRKKNVWELDFVFLIDIHPHLYVIKLLYFGCERKSI